MLPARKFLIYALVFAVVFALTYFGLNILFKEESEPKPVFLKVVGLWESEVFAQLKKDFQKKNPEVTIEYEQRRVDNYYPTLSADLSGETTTPDLFWFHSGWGAGLGPSLATIPREIMTSETYEKTFYPITKTDLKFKEGYRGLPLEIDGLALLYNKAIFASRNLREPPTTWAELKSVYGPALTTRDKQRILNSAIALGSVNNVENFPEIIGLFLLQNDVKFIDKGKLVLSENQSSRGTNLVSDAIEGYVKFSRDDKTWDNTQPNSIDAFATGKTAMIILPAQKIHDLLGKVKKENLTLDFGVAPVPQLPDSNSVTWGSYWSLGVGKVSKEKETAWKLGQYLTSPEALRTVYKLETEKNTFGRAYPRVEMAKEQTTHPYLAAYVTQAKVAKSWYLHSDTKDQALNDSVVAEFKKLVSAIEAGRSSSSSIKDLVEVLTPVLKKYNLVD